MKRKINWLHFSDLHYGQSQQDILLPRVKKELFRDIGDLVKKIGKVDIVFFTGDLTFSGKKDEFDALTVFLEELWDVFRRLDCDPYLIAIPGNHDLFRPDPKDPAVKVLSRYCDEVETRTEFWADIKSGNEHYKIITECFENFSFWYNNTGFRKPSIIEGLLPGDFAATVTIQDFVLKVVGLNSAFLEFKNGDYLGKLAIHPYQLNAVTSGEPLKWVEEADIAVLLTHHEPSWYFTDSLKYYNDEINTSGTFFNHLCGHLHEPKMGQYGQVGSFARRIQVAPSLFGLEKIGDSVSRIHGYIAGSYELDNGHLIENIYPRTAYSLHDGGGYRIAQDMGFTYNKNDHIELDHDLGKPGQIPIAELSETELDEDGFKPQPEQQTLKPTSSIFDSTNNIQSALDKVPRIIYPEKRQHAHVRLTEQQDFTKALSTSHYCWLITDWSVNPDEFIGSTLHNLQIDQKNNFIIDLENIGPEDDLIGAFKEQAGMPLTSFCELSNSLSNHLLVFNQIDERLYSSAGASRVFLDLIKSIIDFSPNTYLILITRKPPDEWTEQNIVKIDRLDAPQVKTYIENSANSEKYLLEPENLAQVIELTGGIPSRIDNLLTKLKYASFQDILQAESENVNQATEMADVPKSLQRTIGLFSDTTERSKLQSYKALKILTILDHGETYNNLKKFIPGETISLDSIVELATVSLLDTIVKQRVLSQGDLSDEQEVKIFKVPRHIRDIINGQLTEIERVEILKNACTLYFGDKWREGSIKKIQYSALKGHKYLNTDNCELIVTSLVKGAILKGDEFEIGRSVTLAANYCDHNFERNDYKHVASCAGEVYQLIELTNLNPLKARIAKVLGQALRMNTFHEKALEILKNALDFYGKFYSNAERNMILCDMAYAYKDQKNMDEAISCCKKVTNSADHRDVHYLTAMHILAEATLSGDALLSKLRTLERAAAKANAHALVSNISFSIVDRFPDAADSNKRYTKIINQDPTEYNKIRALIRRTLDILKEGNKPVSEQDLRLLNGAYEYLYGQRMVRLFDDCHDALWRICIQRKLYPGLVKLFRYSSFIWRISDKEEKERSYFNQLQSQFGHEIDKIPSSPQTRLSLEYYKRRGLEIK